MNAFNFLKIFLITFLVIRCISSSAFSNTWTGSSSSAWNSNSNWSGSSYPNGVSEDVIFGDSANVFNPSISGVVDLNDLHFNNNSAVYLVSGGSLRMNQSGSDTPSLSINGSQAVQITSDLSLLAPAVSIEGNGSSLFTHTGGITTSGTTLISKTGSSVFHINDVDNDASISDGTRWIVQEGELRIDGNFALGNPSVITDSYLTINGGTLGHSGADKTTVWTKSRVEIGASGATIRNYSSQGDLQFESTIKGSSGGDLTVITESGSDVIFNNTSNASVWNGDLILGNIAGEIGRVELKELSNNMNGSIVFNPNNSGATDRSMLKFIDTDGGTFSNDIRLERPSAGQNPYYRIFNKESGTQIDLSGNLQTGSTSGTGNISQFQLAYDSGSVFTLSGENDFTGLQEISISQLEGENGTMELKLADSNALDNLNRLVLTKTLADGNTFKILSTVNGDHTFSTGIYDDQYLKDNLTIVVGGENTSGTVNYSGTIDIRKNHIGSNQTKLQLHSQNTGAASKFSGIIKDNHGTYLNLNVESTGNGKVVLSADNTYTGTTTVVEGTLEIQHENALGEASSSTETTVLSGATLAINSAISLNIDHENFTISGSGFSGGGALKVNDGSHSIQGTIQLAANSTLEISNSEDTLSIVGVVSGSQKNLTKTGQGRLNLTAANDFSGDLIVESGVVHLANQVGGGVRVQTGGLLMGGNGASEISKGGLTMNGGSVSAGGKGSVGHMKFGDSSGDTSYWNDATYVFDIFNQMNPSSTDADGNGILEASGSFGVDWDFMEFSGTLDFSGASTGSITIELHSNGSTDWEWTGGEYYEMKILSAPNIVGFNESFFDLDSSGFMDGDDWWINWKIASHDGALWLQYNAVPEASSYVYGSLLVLFLIFKCKIRVR